MRNSCYNSYYEIQLTRLQENFEKIQKFIGKTKIMPVLKANAYGMGTAEIAAYFVGHCPVEIFACAEVSEGVAIRNNGITTPILILGPAPAHTLPFAVDYDLQIPAFSVEGVQLLQQEAAAQKRIAKVQIKIESGMNRIGVKPGEPLAELLSEIRRSPNVALTGVYTHFVEADEGRTPLTERQFAIFQAAVQQITDAGFSLQYRHICNTPATEWYQEAVDASTHVRIGSLVLGYSDLEGGVNPAGVEEPLSWRASITHIHEIQPGETVGYSRFFTATEPMRVATVGVGFADGLHCALPKGHGPVLVNDTRTHYLDTCMDQCFVDVTGIDCKVGDPVTIFGYSENGTLLSAKELSAYGQIYTAFTSVASERIERIYRY